MVDPGDNVTNTLKKEFGEEALNSLELSPEENKKIHESLEDLFHHGTMVIKKVYKKIVNLFLLCHYHVIFIVIFYLLCYLFIVYYVIFTISLCYFYYFIF